MARSIACVLLFITLTQSHDFDFFNQFSHGIEEVDLRDMFSHDVEPLGAADEEPEELEPFPNFSHHEGFPGGFFNMFLHGTRRQSTGPWWKGQHVCIDKKDTEDKHNGTEYEEDEEGNSEMFGSYEFSTCQQTPRKYTCTTRVNSQGVTKTSVVKYECCHGYKRSRNNACVQADLQPLLATMKAAGAGDLVTMIKNSGLEEKLTTQNLTVFAPSDDALRDFLDKKQQENQVEFFLPPAASRRRRQLHTLSMQDVVRSHMTAAILDIDDIVNEQVLYSEHDNSTLRMNVYPSLGDIRVTCNCARLTSANNMASNGVVHVVDRVLSPVTKPLVELLEQDDQLATFTSMLTKTGLIQKLKEPGHLTLLAPTEEAFRKLPTATLARLLDGHSCLERVVQHHVLPHVLCSAAILGHVTTHNMAGDVMHLERRYDDKLFLDDVQIVIHDVMATNGVIHVINDVIVPDSARPMSEVLLSGNHSMFVSLLNSSHSLNNSSRSLLDELDEMTNITLFAPNDAALVTVNDNVTRMREVLMYHVISQEKLSCDLTNDLMLETQLGQLRVNLYASQPMFLGVRHRATVQCARIIGVDQRACGGVVHTVDRLLVPPVQTVLEQLQADARFTQLLQLIKTAGMEDRINDMSDVTLLAPTNDAFERLDADVQHLLVTDSKMAARVVKQHIITETLCCSGVSRTAWPFTKRVAVLSGDSVSVRRDADDEVHIGSTTVQECDIMATNGIVHAVNRVMGRWRSRETVNHPDLQVLLDSLKRLGF